MYPYGSILHLEKQNHINFLLSHPASQHATEEENMVWYQSYMLLASSI